MKNFFPYLLSILDLVACIGYIFCKDYVRAIYWVSASILTFTTTIME